MKNSLRLILNEKHSEANNDNRTLYAYYDKTALKVKQVRQAELLSTVTQNQIAELTVRELVGDDN